MGVWPRTSAEEGENGAMGYDDLLILLGRDHRTPRRPRHTDASCFGSVRV
jgi:hypothetical protein